MTAFDYEAAAQERNRRNKLLRDAAPDLLPALTEAENFIMGFEDDDIQEGVAELLRTIRAAITRAKGA